MTKVTSEKLTLRFKERLQALGSKESVLTLANWLTFYRKHPCIHELMRFLRDIIITETSESRRRILYFGILNEIMLLQGDRVLGGIDEFKVQIVEILTNEILPKVESSSVLQPEIERMVSEWEVIVENIGMDWKHVWDSVSNTRQVKVAMK